MEQNSTLIPNGIVNETMDVNDKFKSFKMFKISKYEYFDTIAISIIPLLDI